MIGKCCQSQEICLQYFVNITILGQNACWMLQKTIHLARKPFPNFFRALSMKLCHLPFCCCSTEVKNFFEQIRRTIHTNFTYNYYNCLFAFITRIGVEGKQQGSVAGEGRMDGINKCN